MPKREIFTGKSMLDLTERSTKDCKKNGNGNQWRNILNFTYKHQGWVSKRSPERITFINELVDQ